MLARLKRMLGLEKKQKPVEKRQQTPTGSLRERRPAAPPPPKGRLQDRLPADHPRRRPSETVPVPLPPEAPLVTEESAGFKTAVPQEQEPDGPVLARFLEKPHPEPPTQPAEERTDQPANEPTSPFVEPPTDAPSLLTARDKATAHLQSIQNKISKLADDFAGGEINQAQFQQLYSHYRREMKTMESLLEVEEMDENWRDAVSEGQSMLIRKKHAPKATGYAIYENQSGMPLSTLGNFDIDPALLVPMLSSYRAATAEIFGAGVKETEIEGGRTLCFVPGEWTTMMAVFTAEPSEKQLKFLEWLHQLFEKANRHHLPEDPIDVSALIFPQEQYLGRWRR